MTEQNTTDNLLDELEQLEASSEALEQQTEATRQKQEQYQQMESPDQINATAAMLEAAKTAQEAAAHSQKAAETSIKHVNKQKEQIMELSDANFAWRQAVKSSENELKKAQSRFTIMLSATVVTSVAAVSTLGWMLYTLQSKQDQFRGEVLDILQTENSLLSKKITVKVDELASLIERLGADIQALSGGTPIEIEPLQGKPSQPEDSPEQDANTAISGNEATQTSNQDSMETTDALDNAESTVTRATDSEALAELKALVQQILNQQSQLQAKTIHAVQPGSAAAAGLTPEQEKQLKGIGWLVRQQSKTLKSIQATLESSGQPGNGGTEKSYREIQKGLAELKTELSNLKTQQTELQSQVKSLQEQTEKLAAEPKPYRYELPK